VSAQDEGGTGGGLQASGAVAPDWERRVRGLPPGDSWEPSALLGVIVKVSRAGHVPMQLRVRAAVAPTLLTGQTTFAELPSLASDPLVVSVAVGERIAPAPR
jgi:hypothetical protein